MGTPRRLVLVEEGMNQSLIELIVSGDIDESHLEAIDGFVRRQRERLAKQPPAFTAYGPNDDSA